MSAGTPRVRRWARCASAALALGLLAGPGAHPAQAQTRPEITRPDVAPNPTLRSPARASDVRRRVPTVPVPSEDATEPADPALLPEIRPGHRETPPTADSEAGEDAAEATHDGDDPAQIAARLRRVKTDGDLTPEEAPVVPLDGLAPQEAPLTPIDGDLARVREAAELYPDDDDPLADDRLGRPITPQRYGLYQPLGVRVGSFLLYPEAELAGVATDNLFRSSSNRQSDQSLELSPRLRAVSRWSRHALEARVEGTRSWHERFASEDDRKLSGQLRGRIDVSRRTDLQGELYYDYGQETRGTIQGPTLDSTRSNIITRRAAIVVNHRLNRVSGQLRGARIAYDYSSETALDDRSYVQDEAGARLGYLLTPGLRVFVDGSHNTRTRERAALSDGILRNSTGARLRAGLEVALRGTLRGEASIGWATQTPKDARLIASEGLIVDASLTWQPTGLTELVLIAMSDIGEVDIAGSGGALTRRVGLDLRHALRRNLILIAGLSYAVSEYTGVAITEQELKGALGAEYYLSRELALTARYQHTNYVSTAPNADYQDSTVRVGVKLRR